MGADTIRTELKTTEDRRVRAGVRVAIEHVARRHGMTRAEQREFANEVDQECGKAIAAGGEAGTLCDVVIEEREDRMEVRVRHTGTDSKNTKLRASSAKDAEASVSDNGRAVATFVRRFHKSPTHS